MELQALGMIETRGLVAAIEAADAATKASAVKLIGYQKVEGGLIMVAVTGEVGAVQAAVSAGSAAAQKVGQLISRHVIPRPIKDLDLMFKGFVAKTPRDPNYPGQGGNSPGQVSPAETGKIAIASEALTRHEAYLDSLTVVELRRIARKTPGVAIQGRQISKANKEQLISQILRAQSGK